MTAKQQMTKYYHITKNDKETISSIFLDGLLCDNEGYIFLFENKSIIINGVVNTIADCIAQNQIFLDEYVMFEIDSKGIFTNLLRDNVAELSSNNQWRIKQPKIDPRYIELFGIYKTSFQKTT